MKKFLVVTTVAIMVDHFLIPGIKMMQGKGYEVHVACNFEKGNPCSDERLQRIKQKLDELGVKCFQIDFTREITSIKENVNAYKQLFGLINENNYDIVHCHSPIGGALTRFACRKVRKKGTKVLYTAHGFHFYKGAPLKNWLIYYPAEILCSYFTDVLITMNKEDYNLAKEKMRAKAIEYIPGVGIDLQKFESKSTDNYQKSEKIAKCEELGIPTNKIWLLNTGELIPRKNQETLIRAVADMNEVTLTIAGEGILHDNLMRLIEELNISNRVKLIGYRTDISELCKFCDIFIFSSFQEGLPVSLMEAMASGLPCVASDIRGNTDLIDENGGVLFNPYSVNDCKEALNVLLNSDFVKMGKNNEEKIKEYSLESVNKIMLGIYERVI